MFFTNSANNDLQHKIIVMYSDDLQLTVDKAVEEAMKKFLLQPKPQSRKTNLDLKEAKEYLNSIGYKCSYSLIYKKTMANDMPFEKFGRRMSFRADSLSKWVEAQKSKTVDIEGNVSESVNSKLNR